MHSGTPSAERSHIDGIAEPLPALPLYVATCYLALIVYASLHPFSGWRIAGLSPFVFLDAAWPRYWTTFDLAINVATYVPFGFFTAQCIRRHHGRVFSSLTAFLSGVALSFTIESVQTCLPSRVPSNIDFLCNSVGAGLGAALAARYGAKFFASIARAQQRILAPIPHIEYGLVLTGLWLLTQLSPETILFGAGDLRYLFDITPALPYAAPSFFAMETGIIVCNTVATGLFMSTILVGEGRRIWQALLWFFVAALLVRTLATAVLVGPQNALAWLTPGAGLGILVGSATLFLALLLPAPLRIALAGVSLMAGAVLVNLAPFNPYSVAALAAWRQGHFLNFNGLTRLAASFWPFLALPYLILLGRRG